MNLGRLQIENLYFGNMPSKKIAVKNDNTKIKLKNNSNINQACTNPG